MKRIIALCIASAISGSVHADEEGDRQRPPILEMKSAAQMSQEGREERKKAIEALEAKHAHLGELERLAVPIGVHGGPSREQVLPYRFSDVSKLQSMLRDPEWKNHWHKIAATIAMVADKKAAFDLIEFVKSSEAPSGSEEQWNRARGTAIAALGYTLIDQDIPEVLDFLQSMTSDSYAESLSFEGELTPHLAQLKAYAALHVAATDDAIAVLERALSRKIAEQERQAVQAFSAGGQPNQDRDGETRTKIRLLEKHLERAKRERAGIAPEPSNEMP